MINVKLGGHFLLQPNKFKLKSGFQKYFSHPLTNLRVFLRDVWLELSTKTLFKLATEIYEKEKSEAEDFSESKV